MLSSSKQIALILRISNKFRSNRIQAIANMSQTRDKKKQSFREKGNDSINGSTSSTSSPSEKVPKRNLDESSNTCGTSSVIEMNDSLVAEGSLPSTNKSDILSKQKLDLGRNPSNIIPDSASCSSNTLEMSEEHLDSTPNLESKIVRNTYLSNPSLSPKVSESIHGLTCQSLETSVKHDKIATASLTGSEIEGDAMHLQTSDAGNEKILNIEHSLIEDVTPSDDNAVTKAVSITLSLEKDTVILAPANNDINKNLNSTNVLTTQTTSMLQDSSMLKGEPVVSENNASEKQKCTVTDCCLDMKANDDTESVNASETKVHTILKKKEVLFITKECLRGVEAKTDSKPSDDDYKGEKGKSHGEIVSQDKECKTAKSGVVTPESNSTTIFGCTPNSRAYSNTSSNNDGAKDKPKTRSQIAQDEKDRYLKMSLTEKRQYYACDDNYVTLKEVETWPDYFTRSATRLVKKASKNRELKRRCGEVPNPNTIDIDIASKISIWKGDITSLEIDCIVNAANSSLLGGGGVDGAIHRAAGSALVQECRLLNGCDTGDAKTTGGYKLPAKYVIHTVGPTDCSEYKLTRCYRSCLGEMKNNSLHSIAFCCISTGIYGYPNEAAVHVALATARKFLDDQKRKNKISDVERIVFCLFLPVDVDLYESWMQWYFPLPAPDSTSVDKDRVIFLTASEDSGERPKRKELQSPSIKLKECDMTGPTTDKQQDLNETVTSVDLKKDSEEKLTEIKQFQNDAIKESNFISNEYTDVQTDNCIGKSEVSLSGTLSADDILLKKEVKMEIEIDPPKGHDIMEVETEESMETDSLVVTPERSALLNDNFEAEKTHAEIAANL